MSKQAHDLGVIKRKNGQKPLTKEEILKERRKRALPRLYPGWSEDERDIAVVKEELRRYDLQRARDGQTKGGRDA